MRTQPPNISTFNLGSIKTKVAIFFDFDGVFTDNYVYVTENGNEFVRCSRRDGIGLSKLKRLGFDLAVISSEENPVVGKRCEKLQIDCFQGVKDKGRLLKSLLSERKKKGVFSIFVGNDENDITAAVEVNLMIGVADSLPTFLKVADYITYCEGGKGAVREICDFFAQINQKEEKI